ncbi:hypothetical protein EPN54_05920 [bacterium]|nr:MAG: hypothetical protein EPN54_05920 [bacterium]
MPRSPSMINPRISGVKEKIAVWFILVIGFALRLAGIAKKNLWYDELLTNNFTYQLIGLKASWRVSSGTSFFLYKLTSDTTSVLYGLLIYIYSFFFGNWESLRYLSLAFSTAGLIVFYKLARQFLNRQESIYALIIMVLNPFQIWYAQEAREYSLTCFLSVVFIYLFTRALKTNRPSYWAYFTIAGVASVYASYYFLLLLIMCGSVLFIKENRRCLKKWCLSALIIIIAVLPALPLVMKQFYLLNNAFWLRPPGIKSLFLTFGVLSLGYSSGLVELIAGIILFVFLFIYGVYAQYKSRKNDAVMLLALALFPILLVYIISKTIMPIYLDRKLIIFSPFYYLFIAKGIANIRHRLLKIAIMLIVLFLVSSSLFNYYGGGFILSRPDGKDVYEGVHFKKDYYGLMDTVVKNLGNDTALCVTDLQSMIISIQYLVRERTPNIPHVYYFLFYPRLLEPYQKVSIEVNRINFINSPEEENQPYCAQRINGKWIVNKAGLIDKFDRVWLISSAWNREGVLFNNSYEVKKYFSNKYVKLISESKDGILIELYAKNKPNLSRGNNLQ